MKARFAQFFLVLLITLMIGIIAGKILERNPTDSYPVTREEYCKNNQIHELPACPHPKGVYLLPRNFPPLGVFLGYTQNKSHLELVRKVLSVAQSKTPSPRVNLLVNRDEVEVSYESLKTIQNEPYKSFVNIVPTPSEETLWVQDFMEIGIDLQTQETLFIDLPYTLREGERIPFATSLICKSPLVEQEARELDRPDRGDFGGNIEAFPGDVILVGNNMTAKTKQQLSALFTHQEIFEISTDWLETGHVDEIFSFLPLAKESSCPFLVTYASPQLAIDLLDENHSWDQFLGKFDQNIFLGGDDSRADFSSCFKTQNLPEGNPLCQYLRTTNREYDQLIKSELSRLAQKLNSKLKCQVKTQALPLLFAPSSQVLVGPHLGSQARALNPNPINNILLGKDLILPQQINPALQNFVANVVRETGLKVHFIDSHILHQLSGGIHCVSNVIRGCKSIQ